MACIALTQIAPGVLIMAAPSFFFNPTFFHESFLKLYPNLDIVLLLARLSGLLLLYTGMTILSVRHNPSESRDLIFWQGLLFTAKTGFLIAGPFLFHGRYWLFVPAGIWLLCGIFLLAFASRNLLVRE